VSVAVEVRKRPASVFWRYWTATTTSGLGSAVTRVALPLLALGPLHAGSIQVGLLVAAGDIGWLLLTLPAGALVTHVPLRGLQAAVDLVRAVALLAPWLLWVAGDLTMPRLIAAALVVSFANVFAFVANTTYIPQVVPREQLTARNSLMSGTDAATQLGGPSVAGGVVQLLGAPAALLIDAASYLVSGVLMWSLPRASRPPGTRAPIRQQIREGWHYVVRHPLMRPMMIDATATNFACGMLLTLTPLYVVRELGASPTAYGLVLASEGLGALVGASVGSRLGRRFGTGRLLLAAATLSVPSVLVMPLGHGAVGMVAFAVGNALFAFWTVMLSVITRTYRQQQSPPELLARVMATVRFVSWSVIPMGGFLAGWLAAHVGSRTGLWLLAIPVAVSPVVLVASPLRHRREVLT
jgi:MFS family permease